jgi:lysophospholipase L1-like esterase
MLRAADGLRALPGWDVTVNAEVGRQFVAGIPIVADAAAHGADVIIIGLGTNGPFSIQRFDEMMRAAGGARVVLVNIQLPDEAYPYEGPTNDILRAGAARWGATLVDWNAASNGHPEYLRPDGYHLDAPGVAVYLSLVAAAL